MLRSADLVRLRRVLVRHYAGCYCPILVSSILQLSGRGRWADELQLTVCDKIVFSFGGLVAESLSTVATPDVCSRLLLVSPSQPRFGWDPTNREASIAALTVPIRKMTLCLLRICPAPKWATQELGWLMCLNHGSRSSTATAQSDCLCPCVQLHSVQQDLYLARCLDKVLRR